MSEFEEIIKEEIEKIKKRQDKYLANLEDSHLGVDSRTRVSERQSALRDGFSDGAKWAYKYLTNSHSETELEKAYTELQAENAELKERLSSFVVFGSDDCPYCDDLVSRRITLFTRKKECEETHGKQTNEVESE